MSKCIVCGKEGAIKIRITELKELVEGMKKYREQSECDSYGNGFDDGYNKALSDVITLIDGRNR